MSPPLVRVEIQQRVATLTLDRPDRLNALNRALLDELGQALERLAADPAAGALVLTGAGERAFAAGADVTEIAELGPAAALEFSRAGQRLFTRLERLGKPSVAAVRGFALGGGLELALACTLRVAAEDARLGLPEVKLGIIPGYGGTQRLTRLLGPGRALEIILTGEPVEAREALRLGMVNRVVAAVELLPEARRLAAQLAQRAPLALRYASEAVLGGSGDALDQGLEREAHLFALACASEDMREGVRAFLDKRPPRFGGK
jgi:enoyl-CoA hydratase